jgi:hypothetical protein
VPDNEMKSLVEEVKRLGLSREELNKMRAMRVSGQTQSEAEHFYMCPTCGQAVDKRQLGDVVHHEEEGHRPIATN